MWRAVVMLLSGGGTNISSKDWNNGRLFHGLWAMEKELCLSTAGLYLQNPAKSPIQTGVVKIRILEPGRR